MIILKTGFIVPVPDTITLRFYEELNDFLHYSRRKKAFTFSLEGKRTIKDIIESLGVPHTEVDLILANRESVGFDYHPLANDYISIYPVFEAFDITPVIRLRPAPLRNTKFILDVHLGTLARYLRMLGFDSLYRNDYQDDEIIRIALEEQRIILSRDLPLLKNGQVSHGHFVRETSPIKQLKEIIDRFDLKSGINAFHRCLECNGIILKVEKPTIEHLLQPNTRKSFDEFYRCSSCGRIYWKGSHYERMIRIMEKMAL